MFTKPVSLNGSTNNCGDSIGPSHIGSKSPSVPSDFAYTFALNTSPLNVLKFAVVTFAKDLKCVSDKLAVGCGVYDIVTSMLLVSVPPGNIETGNFSPDNLSVIKKSSSGTIVVLLLTFLILVT